MKRVIFLAIAAITVIAGCKKTEKELPGGVYGLVTDQTTGVFIREAGIELSTGATTVTGSDGRYEFAEIEAGKYTLKITKTGYNLAEYEIIIEAGKKALKDVQLKKLPMGLCTVNDKGEIIETLDFGIAESTVSRSFSIFNDNPKSLEWVITNNCDWISGISKINGTLQSGEQQPVSVTIDREKLKAGNNSYILNILSDNGSKELTIKATGETKILPTLNTHATTDVTATTAMFNAEILTKGTPEYTERGFVYSLSPMPTLENSIAKITATLTTNQKYSCKVTELTLGNTYYVRGYAINKAGTAYSSNEASFKTALILPTVTTQDITNLNLSAGVATFNGEIKDVGDPPYTEKGFVYGENKNPDVESDTKKTVSGIGTGNFGSNITGLVLGKIYYVRAYATNTLGTAYGNEKECVFKPVMPNVTTQTALILDQSTVLLTGNITNVGNPAYIEKGFVYGENENPTVENDNKINVSGTGTGTFKTTVSGLTTGKTYYARAYTTNIAETVYGTNISFVPKVTSFVTLESLNIIVQKMDITSGNLNWNMAKSLCESSNLDGLSGWRIPTLSELSVIYDKQNDIGGFNKNMEYWTSYLHYIGSDYTPFYVAIHFGTGATNSYSDGLNRRCRCVRTLP
jgi:hypothetical protein